MPRQITFSFGGRDRLLQADFNFLRIMRENGLAIRNASDLEGVLGDEVNFPVLVAALAATDEYRFTKAKTGVGRFLDITEVAGHLAVGDVMRFAEQLRAVVEDAQADQAVDRAEAGIQPEDPPQAQS